MLLSRFLPISDTIFTLSLHNRKHMITLILMGMVGLMLAGFATQNTNPVTISLGNSLTYEAPLYLLLIGSMLIGISLSWLISITDALTTMFTLRGKDAAIHRSNRAIESLNREIHELKLENARLSGEKDEERPVSVHPPLLHRLKQSLSS